MRLFHVPAGACPGASRGGNDVVRCLVACVFALLTTAAAAQAWREGEVPVAEGVRIHYLEAGDPAAATTILFVPGWATTASVWRDTMAAFAGRARVVAIDPRSQGASTVTPHGNTPEQRSRDLREVMRALALRRVVLVGWSQGVQDVAVHAATFEGQDIAGYVLVDAAVSAGPAEIPPADLKEELGRLGVYARYPREYLRGMMNAIIRSPAAKARIDEYVEAGLRTPPDLGVAMLVTDFLAIDRRPTLAKFNRPTLVIAAASADDAGPQRRMAAAISGARFETIADAGHAVFLDQPERFRQLLADFVERL